MFPKGSEWVIVIVVFLFKLLPIVAVALAAVLLVRRSNRKKAFPSDAADPAQAVSSGPSVPARSASVTPDMAAIEDARGRIDLLLAEYNLTDRERDILVGIYQGKTQAQLAEELFLSRSTVGTYCARAYEKLGVASRDEALEVLKRAAGQR